jgi:hypothetical protein
MLSTSFGFIRLRRKQAAGPRAATRATELRPADWHLSPPVASCAHKQVSTSRCLCLSAGLALTATPSTCAQQGLKFSLGQDARHPSKPLPVRRPSINLALEATDNRENTVDVQQLSTQATVKQPLLGNNSVDALLPWQRENTQ